MIVLFLIIIIQIKGRNLNKNNYTPLYYANNPQMRQLLLSKGAQ